MCYLFCCWNIKTCWSKACSQYGHTCPEGKTEDKKNKRLVDFGDTNDFVYSLLMEACFKYPEAMLVATSYTKDCANELMTILKERFGRVDRQVTQAPVQEFYNTEILSGESGAKFVDRVKSTV